MWYAVGLPTYGVPLSDYQANDLWLILPNYTIESRDARCSITASQKREDDIGVFRPLAESAYILEEGHFDISQYAIEQAARILNWIPQEVADSEHAAIQSRNASLSSRLATSAKKNKRLEARVEELEAQLETAK